MQSKDFEAQVLVSAGKSFIARQATTSEWNGKWNGIRTAARVDIETLLALKEILVDTLPYLVLALLMRIEGKRITMDHKLENHRLTVVSPRRISKLMTIE